MSGKATDGTDKTAGTTAAQPVFTSFTLLYLHISRIIMRSSINVLEKLMTKSPI